MALNTESTTGLLGGHTWQYGNKSGVASFNIVTALATFATSFSGDHLSIRKYSFDIGDYIEEKFVFCDGATYTGATGDIVNVGEAVGNSVNSAIQGIAVKLTVGAAAEAIHTQIGLALNSSNVQIDLSVTEFTGYWLVNLSKNVQDNYPIYYYDSDGTTLIGTDVNVLGISGFNGTQKFAGAQTFSKLQPLYDELVSGGLFVNSISGSDEKAGLTRVNNSTALVDPLSTTDDAVELAKAKKLARAYLAYKKKKK